MKKVILSKTIRKRPFTLPAFIKSTYCPINVSGLVIEIADIKCDNDLEKINKFYESRNWEFYLTTCANMGFMVDRNNPWRLVANISSAPMADASMAYGVETIEQIMKVQILIKFWTARLIIFWKVLCIK